MRTRKAPCRALFMVLLHAAAPLALAGCGGEHVGAWSETTALDCTDGSPIEIVAPEGTEANIPIYCLSLKGNGTFFITHGTIFDVACGDGYDGTYEARDDGEMRIDFDMSQSRYAARPADFDGVGAFVVDDDKLTLMNMWLGRGDQGAVELDAVGCGHEFRRVY